MPTIEQIRFLCNLFLYKLIKVYFSFFFKILYNLQKNLKNCVLYNNGEFVFLFLHFLLVVMFLICFITKLQFSETLFFQFCFCQFVSLSAHDRANSVCSPVVCDCVGVWTVVCRCVCVCVSVCLS